MAQAFIAPVIGTVTVGAFSSEAMIQAGIRSRNTVGLDDDAIYDRYRADNRRVYGADLADMNYFSVGATGWEGRIGSLEGWLVRAGRYGDPTLAVEPRGHEGYALFRDSAAMRRLRGAFHRATAQGITVWVRFASECNLEGSAFSVYDSAARQKAFRHAAAWFRDYMGVRIVCSPLINTPYMAQRVGEWRQIRTMRSLLEPGLWDRIGGTIYATDPRNYGTLEQMWGWWVNFVREYDPYTPLQICELGAPIRAIERREGVVRFLADIGSGRWQGVEKINLFAGAVNGRLQQTHGDYGFIAPGNRESYLKHRFWKDKNNT